MARRTAPILIVFLALASTCAAQPKEGLTKRKPKPTVGKTDSAPVTQAEAAATMARAERVLRPLLTGPVPKSPVSIPKTPRAVTRGEILREMGRIVSLARPSVKFTPRPARFDQGKLVAENEPTRALLTRLVAQGFVPRLSPLAVGKRETLTATEFGDAVGYFMARVAQLTHTPSSRYSPGLMGGG